MSKKNRIILILAQVEINKILKNKKINELSNSDRILVTAYLTTMKNVYIESN